MAEKNLDFDTVIDRTHTNSLKYDFAVQRGKPKDVLPLWVADMDFQVSSYRRSLATWRTASSATARWKAATLRRLRAG